MNLPLPHSVYWNEGQFLCPQHLQLADRLNEGQLFLAQRWTQHYNWGLRSIDIDREALADNRLVVRALQARFRDGTPVAVPEDVPLPTLDLPAQTQGMTVFLVVPLLQPGKRNALEPDLDNPSPAPTEPDEQPRFRAESQEVPDENSGEDLQPLLIRRLNLQLLLAPANRPPAGYEALPICRIARSAETGLPELDSTYIPPVVACDGWEGLQAAILQVIYDRVGKMTDTRSARVLSRSISFDTRSPKSQQLLSELRVLNEGYAVLHVVAFAEGIHPFSAYLELCRLAGQAAIFLPARRVPNLPRYDHDDLAGCFYAIKRILDEWPDDEQTYLMEPFIGEKLHLKVAIKEEWLDQAWQMFVGVRSPLTPAECINLLTRRDLLPMKIGSAPRVDRIFDEGDLGLKFTPAAQPPQALPVEPVLVFFQVSRQSNQAEWQNVKSSLSLGVRVNLNRIDNRVPPDNNVEGLRQLKVKTTKGSIPLEFTLYLLPPGVAQVESTGSAN